MPNNLFCFRKSCRLCECGKKIGTARQATDSIIREMCFACWISKARIQTHTHTQNM